MASGGQRIVPTGQGGPIMVARPQGQQQMVPGGQMVRTSSGGIFLGPQRPTTPMQTQIIRPNMQMVPSSGAGEQNLVIRQNGARPGQPGAQITVPLSTLQGLQAGQGIPTGQPGHLLVKTEKGQYQILRVGPPGQQGGAQTVAVSTPSVSVASQPQHTVVRPSTIPVSSGVVMRPTPTQMVHQVRQPTPTATPPVRPINTPITTQPTQSAAASASNSMGQQMTPDTAKIKCKNFLATLLRLASDQPEGVARNVRALIQGLIDGRVEPEIFTTKLQKELNSSPQPCLVPFLKKSLPYLQQSLATHELSIEGVRPPSLSQVGKLPPSISSPAPMRISSPAVGAVGPTPRPQPAIVNRPITPRTTLPRPEYTSVSSNIHRPGFTMPQNQSNLSSSKSSLPVIRDKKSGNSYSAAGDDDINDVAAMGGVNLQEEANKILGSTDNVGTVIRSCKDETFLQTGLLHQKISRICREKGLEAPSQEVIGLVSHATQDRLKTLVSKLSVIAEHRLDIIKTEGPYEVTDDIKGQMRFLEDLDKMEKKRQEEMEREMLIRAAKSRTKTDDPEKEKMKAKAKELQRIEQEQQRHSEANATALAAIGGPKSKKFKFDENNKMGSTAPLRPRTKRVHLRDVIFLMEQEKDLRHSPLLFRSYCS